MSVLKIDDKAIESSQQHLEHATSQQKEDKTSAGTLDQVLANGFGTHITNEDRAAALKMAQAADPGPDVYSWRYMKFVMLAIVACVCSGDNGFDGTVMSSVNSMVQFRTYFDISLDSKTSLLFGIYTVGSVCSFFGASIIPDLFGRRYGMFIGNTILIVGALISGLATSFGMLLGGRFLTGFGGGIANNSSKSYLTEITPPTTRGRWMGLLNSFYYVGQILATGISIPFGKRLYSTSSWRAPILVQIAPAITNVAFIMFLPESPRWLYSRGRREEAVKILAKYHSKTGDINSPMIQLEIQEIEERISLDGADKRWWDFRALFKTGANRYRFWLCSITSIWGQLSGNGLITYFLPVLLRQAGIVNEDRQRVLNLVNSVTSFMGALAGTAVVDHFGRRPLLLFASFASTAGMAIVAGLLSPAGPQSTTRANAGISFIFLFMVFFSFGWTPLQALYPAEVLAYENRAKGLALQGWVTSAVSCINTFGLPPALAALNWKTYLIFMAWDVVGIVTIWYFIVETKQLSLEELDDVFEASSPRKKASALFKQARKRANAEKRGETYIDDSA